MPRLRVSKAARKELDEIWLYIAIDNPEAATSVLESITTPFDLLASHPESGRSRDDLAPGLRSFPVGSYMIYYRRERNALQIVRVVHAARDAQSIFRTTP